jgi:TonB-dependent SusC/RagA subfamily outer membrane receptor
MINRHSHTNYSLEDIEKYLQGKMDAGEMHLLEKATLQDPFLADAIEGYRENSLPAARIHLQEIQNRLLQKETPEEPKVTSVTEKNPPPEIKVLPLHPPASARNAFATRAVKEWYRVAAVLVVMVTGFVLWKMARLSNPDNKQRLAYQYQQPGNAAKNKNGVVAQTDSTVISADKNNKTRVKTITLNNQGTAYQNIRTGKIRLPGDKYSDKYHVTQISHKPDELQGKYPGNRPSGSSASNSKQLTITTVNPQAKKDSTIPTLSPVTKNAIDNTVAVFSQNLLKQPSLNTGEGRALQGSVAGPALSKNKIKERQVEINIRGTQTTNAVNQPLYVIDGIVYDSMPALINPAMIDRIEVLKDSNATAVYGARAAYGIIMISTKLKNKQLRGRIVNRNGEGIANASIIISHNKPNLRSDTQGNFTVNSFDSSANISVSAVGYESQQGLINAGQKNLIILRENEFSLNDVIIIGHGTKKRATVTGAVSVNPTANYAVIKADTIVPHTGLEKKAAGNATGVSNNSGLSIDTLTPEGGWNNFKAYLLRQINAAGTSLKGDLIFEFTVNKIHKPIHVHILQSPDKSKNRQIIQAVEQGPGWVTLMKRKNKRNKQKVTFTF